MHRPRCVAGRVQGQFEGEMYITCIPPCQPQLLPRGRAGGTRLKEPSSMEFQDKVLKCIDCGSDFIFTAGEQLFFHDKQFKNEPKRCKACKTKRGGVLGAPPVLGQGYRYTKVETQATCSGCGKQTTVPFRPTQGRPVFC